VSSAAGDPYLEPASGVLRDLLGITDTAELARAEGGAVRVAADRPGTAAAARPLRPRPPARGEGQTAQPSPISLPGTSGISRNTSISCRTRKNQAARRTRTSQTTQRKHGLTSGAEPAPAPPGLATQHRKGKPRPQSCSSRQMSMPKPVCPNMATATPLGPPEPRRRRSSTPGCSSWTRNHPLQNPSSRGRGTEGLCLGAASLRSGHLRGIGPEPEPGRILIPGDGAAGDQGAQNRPACPAMAARDACGLSRLNDLLALWSQAHMPSCNRQVTSTSVHIAKPGSASAPRGHAPL
jgi:hypothetical protein